MANSRPTDESLIRQIELLREYVELQRHMTDALVRADLAEFELKRVAADAVFARVEQLDPDAGRCTDAALVETRRQVAEEAAKANGENRKLLEALLDEMRGQRRRMIQGRRALAGYKRGLKSGKRPAIISDDI